MRAPPEILAAKLQTELGTKTVTLKQRLLDSHSIDGKSPTILCLPSSPEQVSAALRICAEAQAAAVPWGGGTSMALGNIPRRLDIVIGLDKLSKLVEHDDANLTATVQAGMRLAAFQ